jgi:hypothetical protein
MAFNFSLTNYLHPTIEFFPLCEVANATQVSSVLYTSKNSPAGKSILEAVKKADTWTLRTSFIVQYVDDLAEAQMKELEIGLSRLQLDDFDDPVDDLAEAQMKELEIGLSRLQLDDFDDPILVRGVCRFKYSSDGIYQVLKIKK